MPKENRLRCFMTPTGPVTRTSPYGSFVTDKGPPYVPDVTGWINRLSAKLLTESGGPDDRNDIEAICQGVLRRFQEWRTKSPNDPKPHPDTDLARVISACVEHDKRDMFLEGFGMCPPKVSSSMFRSVGIALVRWQLEELLPQ